MNAASVPYRTALLITMSISYSRYFRTAMPTAAYRPRNARFCSTVATTEFVTIAGIMAATTSTAAVANHFSCSRSSPEDRANRTTTAATLITSVAGRRIWITARAPGSCPWGNGLNGSDQTRVARTSWASPVSVYTPATNHAAGSHRRERSRPVGNSRSRKASSATWITKIQLESQAISRPAARDPGSATRACSAYGFAKLPRPSARPAARNSQPMRLPGRREARTKPRTGTPRFTTFMKTSEKFQVTWSAGSACRSA